MTTQNPTVPPRTYDRNNIDTWPQRRDKPNGPFTVVQVSEATLDGVLASTLPYSEKFLAWYKTEEICPCGTPFLAKFYPESVPQQATPGNASASVVTIPHLHVACTKCGDWASTNRYGKAKI